MDKQSTKKVQLEVLQKRLEAKVKDHGIQVFKCAILPGGVFHMGYTIPDQSVNMLSVQNSKKLANP